jgi:hypothetical protein
MTLRVWIVPSRPPRFRHTSLRGTPSHSRRSRCGPNHVERLLGQVNARVGSRRVTFRNLGRLDRLLTLIAIDLRGD